MQQGNVSAMATSLTPSGQRRLWRCHTCETPFSETRETVFFALRTAEDTVMMARKRLLVRVALAGIGVVRGVTAETVLGWLRRAAPQAEERNRHLRRALPVTQGPLDEMGHCSERQQTGETDATGESGPASAEGRQWVWLSLAPEWRLMIAAIGGPRTLATAQEVVATTKARVAGIPAFFREGFTGYLAALIAAFHVVTTLARTGKRGRPRKPRGAPHPALVYGPLGKQKNQGQLRTLRTRVVLGAERLTHLGLTSSTAWVERVNVTWRQALAPLARQTSSCCQERERRRQRVVFCQAFYNRARPHMRLRQQWPPHERTCQGAIRLRGQERTPAMAAGLADPVWALRELLTATFEPLDSQSISG
jgi:hypothetical protein